MQWVLYLYFLRIIMIKYSTALATALNNAVSKKAWCAKLIELLGNTLTFECKRDSNAIAPDPWATGTTFYKGSLYGALKTKGDSVVNFGYTRNVTTKLAADLSTGKSVLRILGNGHWIEFTLGLITSPCDIRFKASPTSKTGLSISNISIAAKRSLPFGIGPAAPADTVNTTVTVVIEDMQNPAYPKVVGNLHLDLPRDNFIFEDNEMATQFGDIRITQTSKTVVFGQFEFGVTRFDMNKVLNSEADVPVEQGLIYCKPFGVWPTYPLMDTWRMARDLTYPKAFRARLLRKDGTTWKTLQMRDGLPINSPELSQTWSNEKPLRPHWNCGMMLPWQSHLPKHSDLLAKYFNGMEPDSIRPSQAKEGDSANAAVPLYSGSAQINGQLQLNAVPQWPTRRDAVWGGSPDVNAQDTFDDEYLYDVKSWHSDEGRSHLLSGWDYEVGSISCHDHLAYKGGVRSDRSIVNHAMAMFASDPTSRRIKGNVLWRDMVNGYGLAIFNTAHHWVTDVSTCDTLPKELVCTGKVGTYGARYSGRVTDLPGGVTRAMNAHGLGDGMPWPEPYERGGHPNLWGGFQLDHLHNSLAPGLWTILLNSIMHVVSQKMRFVGGVMSQTGSGLPPNVSAKDYWLTRQHSFRWLQYTVQWKLGTKHSLGGFTQEDILSMFQKDLESVYDDIVIPTNDPTTQDPYCIALRNFGIHAVGWEGQRAKVDVNGNWMYDGQGNVILEPAVGWIMNHDSKVFYLSHMMVLMRQFGLWKVLRDRNAKCRAGLDFLLECLDKYAIDAFYHSQGRIALHAGSLGKTALKLPAPQVTPYPDMATGWEDWALTVEPKQGLEDMVTNKEGQITSNPGGNQGATSHLRQQYILMRSIYFPEYPHPLLAATEVMVRAQYKKHSDWIKSMSGKRVQATNDYKWKWAPHGILKPPSILEPI